MHPLKTKLKTQHTVLVAMSLVLGLGAVGFAVLPLQRSPEEPLSKDQIEQRPPDVQDANLEAEAVSSPDQENNAYEQIEPEPPRLPPPPTPAESIPVAVPLDSRRIRIYGDEDCLTKTTRALEQLRMRSPLHDAIVAHYIGIIECVQMGSGMYVEEHPPRYQVGKPTWNGDMIWYAGTIVHDACHSRQYNDYLALHSSSEVPREVHFGRNPEIECNNVQIEALRNLGASQETIEYVRNSINTEYWEARERNW